MLLQPIPTTFPISNIRPLFLGRFSFQLARRPALMVLLAGIPQVESLRFQLNFLMNRKCTRNARGDRPCFKRCDTCSDVDLFRTVVGDDVWDSDREGYPER